MDHASSTVSPTAGIFNARIWTGFRWNKAACRARITGMKQWVVTALLVLVSAGCEKSEKETVYQARGVIQAIEPDGRTARIKHEDIPGYMMAMTMPLTVKNTNDLAGFKSGDIVNFEMVVTPEEGWIRHLVRIGSTNVDAATPAREVFRRVRDVDPLEVGQSLPDYTFTNELGRKISLTEYRGQAVALTFIFTRCPFPNFCPRMTSNFGKAIQLLEEKTGGKTNFHFLSISFDPEFDTPERLLKHAQAQKYPPDQWSFLTGAQIDIDAITEQFGLGFAYREGTFDHTLRTAVIDSKGVIRKIYIGNTWTPEELAEEMLKSSGF